MNLEQLAGRKLERKTKVLGEIDRGGSGLPITNLAFYFAANII
jgi:hypothetical protein